MATIKEIASRAKVSIGTVSNVITGRTAVSPRRRERVLAAIRALDYQPNHVARSLKLRKTRMLGMVISDITNPFFPQLVRGAEDVALKHGYLLITFNTDDNVEREKQVLLVLRQRRVDGVLLVVAPNPSKDEHIRSLLQSDIPTVYLDRVPTGMEVDSVSVDNVEGSRNCVRHLISLGHRKIAIVTGPPSLQTAAERLQGYREAMHEAGIPTYPELIMEGNFRAEGGYLRGRELLAGTDRPTAVFVCNNMMSLGLLKALVELGLRCPEDIAIAMFDDFPMAEAFRPRMTAVVQPAYSIGYRGAELLIERIERKRADQTPVRIRLSTDLLIRESSAGYRFTRTPGS
jgi:LacI family transcriptional regulator